MSGCVEGGLSTNGVFRVGVISDTHGLLRLEALEALRGSGHIFHVGDVGDAGILDALREVAPTTAIRGNVDGSGPCAELPETEAAVIGGKLFYLVHSLADLDLDPVVAGVACVLSGHSHKAAMVEREGVLYLNPGSAGPRRFRLPVTVGRITIEGAKLDAEIVDLEV